VPGRPERVQVVQALGARLFRASSDMRARPALSYLLALAAFAIALALRFAVNGVLPSGFPYLTFFPAVLLTAFFCGTGPGFLVAALSVLSAWYWFIAPINGFGFGLDLQSAVAVLFFVAILSADLLIIHIMHSALDNLVREQARAAGLLEQQKTLFEELQHRTANNMAFISALLAMYKRKVKGAPELVAAFDSAAARLDTMSRVHRRLYHPGNIDLPLKSYLEDLVTDIFRSSGREAVSVTVSAPAPRLDVHRLLTLSLVVSELATNAAKHAFADSTGRFDIVLDTSPDGRSYVLDVRDDGPGYPDGFDPADSDRLGFRVLTSFARTLAGTLAFGKAGGATIRLEFPLADPRSA
jgi:two-component sensor histidine kinase